MADRRATTQSVAKSIEKLANVVDHLSDRIERMENRGSGGNPEKDTSSYGGRGFCALPIVKEPEYPANVMGARLELLQMLNKKWVNHTVLHYYFFTSGIYRGSNDDINVVRRAFAAWKELGIGLEFVEVIDISEAEIRIGFLRGDGAWSYVGRDVLDIGQNQRTMNFGWKLAGSGAAGDDIDTAIHEIGHSLGFLYEHQNPNSGIEWNEEAVYQDLAGPPNNWTRDKTFYNIIRKLPAAEVEGSDWDSDSIMHYPFGPGMINRPERFRQGLSPKPGLSTADKEQVRRFYPDEPEIDELVPYESKRLSLAAGEQVNYGIAVDSTRDYSFATFGASDTVMVLFEKVGEEFRYVIGDDDSGTSLNARFTVRLRPQREYMLRIRLYSQYSEGDTAVLMW